MTFDRSTEDPSQGILRGWVAVEWAFLDERDSLRGKCLLASASLMEEK